VRVTDWILQSKARERYALEKEFTKEPIGPIARRTSCAASVTLGECPGDCQSGMLISSMDGRRSGPEAKRNQE
jgi:hypothetical protein